MKRIVSLLIICFLASQTYTFAQKDAYTLKIQVKGISDTICYLANFYGKNQYYKDTANVDADGKMIFTGKEPLEEGMYSLVIGTNKLFDLFVVEQEFSMVTDTSNTTGLMQIKGSKDNQLFYEYVQHLDEYQKKAVKWNEQYTSEDKAKKDEAVEELTKLDKGVKAYQKEFVEANKGTLAANFVNATREIEVPEAPVLENGKKDSLFQYRYYKDHFLDNIDFTDGRLIRTPVYHQKISRYIEKLTYQIPDSLFVSIDYLLNKTRANYDLFRYTVSWITNTYEKSNVMGMDAIFVHMAENYYLTDDVDWTDSTQHAKISERYQKTKPLLIGKVAPNIVLADTAQTKWYNLHQLESEYTIVYIWSPTCGHCKKVTPKMHDLYLKYKDEGLNVFAVGTEFDNKEWKKFIVKHNLTWINVSDSPEYPNNVKDHPNNFRSNYDVFSTPKIYLLDKDKKIIAKKLEDEQLDDLLGKLIKAKNKG